MRKLVNGKIVDIQNIELFEKAAEGMAIGRTLSNVIPNESLDLNFDIVEKYIEAYKEFYTSLPFPLYGVDTDLKYCTAGLYIKKKVDISTKMWTSDGLYISIDPDRLLALGFINNSWGIVKVDSIKEDNLDIQSYRGELGFDDFVWILATLFTGASAAAYYKVFMQKFVAACSNQALVLKWELSNILTFGNVPSKIYIPTDRIVNLDKNLYYILDIFVAGTRETKQKQHVWNLTGSGSDSDMVLKPKLIKVYGYDLYEKPITFDESNLKPGQDKIKPVEMFGINSLFCTLCSIKEVGSEEDFASFQGIVSDNNFVFSVRNRIFVAHARNYVEAKEVARGVEIYSYKAGIVYFVKPKIVAPGIRKEVIYSYSLVDGNLRLCKIQFVRV